MDGTAADARVGGEATTVHVREDERHRRTWGHAAGLAAAVALVAGCATALAAALRLGFLRLPLSTAFAISLVATFWSAWRLLSSDGRRSPRQAAEMELRGDELLLRPLVGAGLAIPFADIEQGWLEEPSTIVLRTVDGLVIAADVEEREQRTRVLHAIGVGAGQSVVRVPICGIASQFPCGGLLRGCLALAAIASAIAPAIGLARLVEVQQGAGEMDRLGGALAHAAIVALASAVALLGVRIVSQLLGPRQVVVGADGVLVLGLLRSFYRFEEIREAGPVERGVLLTLEDGRAVLLPTFTRAGPPWREGAVRRQVLLDGIRHGASRPSSPVATVKLDLLARNGRPLPAWRQALRSLTTAPGDYRMSVVTREDLSDVVADGAAPAELRIAAAYALSTADDDARRRVRVAIDACADEDLRTALEDAAAGRLHASEVRA